MNYKTHGIGGIYLDGVSVKVLYSKAYKYRGDNYLVLETVKNEDSPVDLKCGDVVELKLPVTNTTYNVCIAKPVLIGVKTVTFSVIKL